MVLRMVLAAWLLAGVAVAQEPPRNVLLFTIDSCRADRFGVYGNDPSPTPHVDRWAAKGTVFTQAYSTSAWTAPGLASILTGLYPPVHGINNRDRMGSADLLTLVKIFRKDGFEVPNLNFFTFAPYYANLGLGDVQRRYFGSREGQELVGWLRQRDRRKRFFLWYHSTTVHQPYDPGGDNLPAPKEELMGRPGIRAAMTGAIVPLGSTSFSDGDRPLLLKLYDAEMRRMDALFGKALEMLEEQGALEDTLVLLTSDHGEELLEHGFVGHASTSLKAQLYEEHIRIPLIVAWPGRLPEGERDDRLASQIDILPTVLKRFGRPVPDFVQGRDLFAEPEEGRALFFSSVIAGNQTPKDREHLWVRAVREGRFKYIDRGELYDLESDPGERNNLADEKPAKVRRLESELDAWLRRSRDLAERIFEAEPDVHTSARPDGCPRIHTPQPGEKLQWDVHTGSLLFDWSGDLETEYLIEYDIGTGDHHVEGVYEVEGNHQLLGPFSRELWGNLEAWNPFRIRVSPKTDPPCWSEWRQFQF